jgi:hypothetical protein
VSAATIDSPAGILSEHVLSLDEAAERLPAGRSGQATAPSTVFRWIVTGYRLPGGRLVRLDGVKVGRRWLTSVEALHRFADALTAEARPALAPEGA